MKNISTEKLAREITYKSSLRTYLIIRLLADKCLVKDAFKAYGYFRWLDDQVDMYQKTKRNRVSFIDRQKQLIDACYAKKPVKPVCPEEKMIVELIASDPAQRGKDSKLRSFILNFFAIIEFDAYRKNTFISQKELTWYSKTLAKAVTDGIEHFINHTYQYPDSPNHYKAAFGAHITHMIRDSLEDIPAGYINIPKEYLREYSLKPADSNAPALQNWVKQQADKARKELHLGKQYITKLRVLRGKLAASWYCCRFESVLNSVEKDKYKLRLRYNNANFCNYMWLLFVTFRIVSSHMFYILLKGKPV